MALNAPLVIAGVVFLILIWTAVILTHTVLTVPASLSVFLWIAAVANTILLVYLFFNNFQWMTRSSPIRENTV